MVCYICGQQFGTASIAIHVPHCQDKWHKVEAQKRRHERKPLPLAPPGFEDALRNGLDNVDLEALNEASTKLYKSESLSVCACGRSFFPEQLKKHIKSCHVAKEQGFTGSHEAKCKFRWPQPKW